MTLPERPAVAGLSGNRFEVAYLLNTDDHADAKDRAFKIAVEQTIEFPPDLAPEGDICDHVIGQVRVVSPTDDGRHRVVISYANETAGPDLAQFLNVVYGNVSLLPGVRLEKLYLPTEKLADFKGPRYGREGVRDLVKVYDRPLLCSALKPMGLSAEMLADMAYQFACGGLDLIKDDHGLVNQPFSEFKVRAKLCAEAVARANAETGLNCLYLPNVTAPAHRVLDYARYAVEMGAGGLLICPGIIGFDTMRMLADDDDINVPIMSHPSFSGAMVTNPTTGMDHYVMYGQLQRLAGADMTVYPNFGGRFSFSEAECRAIVDATEVEMGDLKPIFPSPGGGMTMEKVPTLNAFYGRDVVCLVGGGLHRHSDDLTENVRYFIQLISEPTI